MGHPVYRLFLTVFSVNYYVSSTVSTQLQRQRKTLENQYRVTAKKFPSQLRFQMILRYFEFEFFIPCKSNVVSHSKIPKKKNLPSRLQMFTSSLLLKFVDLFAWKRFQYAYRRFSVIFTSSAKVKKPFEDHIKKSQ